jgi:ABC-2 type transport system ATP-binding protein
LNPRDLYVAAAENGVQIRRIQLRRDSLEDIFLRAMDYEGGRVEHVSV